MDKTKQFYNFWEKTSPIYGEFHIYVHHKPYLIKIQVAEHFKRIIEPLQMAVERVTDLYLQGKFRNIFQFEPRLKDLIEVDPGYPMACPISRWDSFWDGSSLKLMEMNTDGTSGMVYIEALERLYMEVFGPQKAPCHLRERILKTLLACYRSFAKKRGERPQMAIVDLRDVKTLSEQQALCDYIDQSGYLCILADPRDLRYDGSCLWKDDFRIDLVYRRIVTGDYLLIWDDVNPMTKAYLDQNVCVVGSFRSQIGFDKRSFEILSSPEYDSLFTDEQNQLRLNHIPWTRVLKNKDTIYQDKTLPLLDWIKSNRKDYILKPPALSRGRGVVFGADVTELEWDRQIEAGISQGFIVQERLQVPPWGENGWGFHLGHFVFAGQLAGWMCRAGTDLILGDNSDDRMIPCFVV